MMVAAKPRWYSTACCNVRLQSVLNAADRLMHRSSRHEHVTPLPRDLHWLRSREDISFKLAVRACVSMPVRSRSSLSLWSFPTCHQLQSPTTSFIVMIVVTDPTNTTHYSRRPCLSGDRKPSLEQSAARRHISSDSCCFRESTQNLPVLSFIDWRLYVV